MNIPKCEKCGRDKPRFITECFCKEQKCRLCGKPAWYRVCRECNLLTLWEQLRIYINNFENGKIITRQGILKVIGHGYQTTIDSYNNGLKKLGIIESIKPGKYIKRNDFPKLMTIGIMRELAYTSWKSWFIPAEMIDSYIKERNDGILQR